MKPFERNLLDCFIDDLENPGVETVHLGVALKTHHAVTDVPNAGRAVPVNSVGVAFDVSEQQHTVRPFNVMIGAVSAKELQPIVIVSAVEGLIPDLRKERGYF